MDEASELGWPRRGDAVIAPVGGAGSTSYDCEYMFSGSWPQSGFIKPHPGNDFLPAGAAGRPVARTHTVGHGKAVEAGRLNGFCSVGK
jgi:hypothetical protein